MPVCLKCKNPFPNRMEIEGKIRLLNKRKYCLECSPFGLHNNRQIHIDESSKLCKICNRPVYGKDHTTGKYKNYSVCPSCHTNRRRFQRKDDILNVLGNRCSVCGYDKCKQALEVHHRNPEEKTIDVGSSHCLSWIRISEELRKCVLLCSNCHREHHAGLISVDLIPDTFNEDVNTNILARSRKKIVEEFKKDPKRIRNIDTVLCNRETVERHMNELSRNRELLEKKIQSKLERSCKRCGLPLPYANKTYCSDSCMNLSYRKVERPSLEELLQQLSKSSFLETGRTYGVSDSTIRKWLRRYGLTTIEIKCLVSDRYINLRGEYVFSRPTD